MVISHQIVATQARPGKLVANQQFTLKHFMPDHHLEGYPTVTRCTHPVTKAGTNNTQQAADAKLERIYPVDLTLYQKVAEYEYHQAIAPFYQVSIRV